MSFRTEVRKFLGAEAEPLKESEQRDITQKKELRVGNIGISKTWSWVQVTETRVNVEFIWEGVDIHEQEHLRASVNGEDFFFFIVHQHLEVEETNKNQARK